MTDILLYSVDGQLKSSTAAARITFERTPARGDVLALNGITYGIVLITFLGGYLAVVHAREIHKDRIGHWFEIAEWILNGDAWKPFEKDGLIDA